MTLETPLRTDRLSKDKKVESRNDFKRDRDRILYAGAFRRLVGVTQVISPVDGEVFHNRLTHTLKVAQVARRLAERFIDSGEGAKKAEGWRGIDPDVVEAAALAHDLGHPPFGHVAEDVLRDLLKDSYKSGGFEGNAQSFRILTRLAVRRPTPPYGLDLTRATLNATLKYATLPIPGEKKFGAYKDDRPAFVFARTMHKEEDHSPSAEAQIMDWADDITYSVHDTEDFYRAGLVPLHLLVRGEDERDQFIAKAVKRRELAGRPFTLDGKPASLDDLKRIFNKFCSFIPVREAYRGTREQRGQLAQFTSKAVELFDGATSLADPAGGPGCLERSEEILLQVALLKEVIGVYVFDNPALAAHEYGQRKIIESLFGVFRDAAAKDDWKLFPPQVRDVAEEMKLEQEELGGAICDRLAADTIASLTDNQALQMHQRLTGQSLGAALDPIMS